jgi:UDP-N-acetylmuramyl tripeptide synthase
VHMPKLYVTLLGKSVRRLARLRGNGSALPGLVVERVDPHFLRDILSKLPNGVIVISGTNGKTTTAKMVVELLESQGLKVFTNRTGSNFTRGVVAALLSEINLKGKLNAHIAVLELDEAHATHFVTEVQPKYSLILNVLRDQLDRFGEIDYTTDLLRKIVKATSVGVVLNREDRRIAELSKDAGHARVSYFGLNEKLLKTFPSDDALRGEALQPQLRVHSDVTLESFKSSSAVFKLGNDEIEANLKLNGIYNVYNVAAALALVRSILGDSINKPKLLNALENIKPAFGRGESFVFGKHSIELILVKNPSGFRLGLQSFKPKGYATMIAINDNYADGRDMSWLWDVDFQSLSAYGVSQVSGTRAYDMALRLQYDDVPVGSVESNLSKALEYFIQDNPDSSLRIYCTYTAMLSLRRELRRSVKVEDIT